MAGTIIITGANSSLAIPLVHYLLTNYPDLTAVLTLHHAEDTDDRTKRLREVISKHPNAKVMIHQLDLASLSQVREFASTISSEITKGHLPPMVAIVCIAYYWNLVGAPELTEDGYDMAFQVTHLAHVALVLRLLGSYAPAGGRVVLLSCEHHRVMPYRRDYPITIPRDLKLLVRPDPNELSKENSIRGL